MSDDEEGTITINDVEEGRDELSSIFRQPQVSPISRFSRFLLGGGQRNGRQNSDNNNNNTDDDDNNNDSSPAIRVPMYSPSLRSMLSMGNSISYGSVSVDDTDYFRSIRFQVVIWYVGRPDEVLGKVDMKFRVTLFWHVPPDEKMDNLEGYGMNNPYNHKIWHMHGRQRAYQRELPEVIQGQKIVYVPPVSILNAVDFEIIGEPEVCLLQPDEHLMKWSCLYKASLLQDSMNVANFPHDNHDLVLRLAILKHRQRHKRWDKYRWKLDLATRDDTKDSIHIPHGLIVDHVKVPGFSYDNKKDGLQFQFVPMEFGSRSGTDGYDDANGDNDDGEILPRKDERDQCLQVKLRVERESSYYDRNIIPLLAALNFVAICTLAPDGSYFGARGEMILAISFVEIGIRMTVDSRLPVVGYQIKMQFILNNFFFGLLALVVESSAAYLLKDQGFDVSSRRLDEYTAICSLVHLIITLSIYWNGSGNVFDRIFLSRWDKRFILSSF